MRKQHFTWCVRVTFCSIRFEKATKVRLYTDWTLTNIKCLSSSLCIQHSALNIHLFYNFSFKHCNILLEMKWNSNICKFNSGNVFQPHVSNAYLHTDQRVAPTPIENICFPLSFLKCKYKFPCFVYTAFLPLSRLNIFNKKKLFA